MNEDEIKDLYKVSRAQIEHLDNTISQRITCLVIAQSFFFSGYAILVTGIPTDTVFQGRQHMLAILFPASAILMNMMSFIDILSGTLYLKKLARSFSSRSADNKINATYPPIDGFKKLNRLKNLSALTVPGIFTSIWVFILCW